MPASRSTRATRASHQREAEEALKRPAPESDQSSNTEAAEQPAVPDLTGAPVAPEAWLSLQQSIGNSAVGSLVERRRAGQALPAGVRHDMEASFGQNFGEVQIHSGPEVDQAVQSLDAAAFTVSDDIYLSSAVPGPDQALGREVLGEELAHVAQGVGREGVDRVTAPDETAERHAHSAGRAAAAGEPAEVNSAPEASTALARVSLLDVAGVGARTIGSGLHHLYESAFGGAPEAQVQEKTGLSDVEKDRLQAGGLAPLRSLLDTLQTNIAAKQTKPKDLQPIFDDSRTLPSFILSFQGAAGVQSTVEMAASQTARGQSGILAAIDPAALAQDQARILSDRAAEIRGLAAAPQPAAPAPAGSSSPAPQGLTPTEAEQLKAAAADPLDVCAAQLTGEAPNHMLIANRLKDIPALLRSYGQTPEMTKELHRIALGVQAAADAINLSDLNLGNALWEAQNSWSQAVATLEGLTAKSPTGGVVTLPEMVVTGEDDGDDDDKK